MLANPVWDDQVRQTIVDYINSLRMRSDARVGGAVTTPIYRYPAKDACAQDQAAYDYHEYWEHSRTHAAVADAYPEGCDPVSQCSSINSTMYSDKYNIADCRTVLLAMFNEKDYSDCWASDYSCPNCGHWYILTSAYTQLAVGHYMGFADHGTYINYNFYN
jgi:hypothetical protein